MQDDKYGNFLHNVQDWLLLSSVGTVEAVERNSIRTGGIPLHDFSERMLSTTTKDQMLMRQYQDHPKQSQAFKKVTAELTQCLNHFAFF